MKKRLILAVMLVLFVFTGNSLAAEPSLAGTWALTARKGPNVGKVSAYLEITEQNGVYSGKLVKLFFAPSGAICKKCPDERKDKPILGMTILTDLKKTGTKDGVPEFGEGKLLSIDHGRVVNCTIWPEGPSKLKVKGFVGFIGETFYWTRVK